MDGHIEKQQFKKTLTSEELKHISSCPYCREVLTKQVEQFELLTAPKSLKASVMQRSKQLDVQLIAGSNQLSKRLQLFYFSLKVSAAVLCVLTMLTIAPRFAGQLENRWQDAIDQRPLTQQAGREWRYYEKVENLTARLYELSNSNMEVFDYDKKEQ